MTNAKQWLGRARTIARELQALRETRKTTFEQLTRITQNYTGDGAQSTKDPHKLDRLVEIDSLIDQHETELLQTQLEVTEAIIHVPSGNQRAVLLSYYVAGKTLEEIAVEIGCSARNVQNLRKRGASWLEKNF